MRKQKQIEIDGKKIVINELTVEQITDLLDSEATNVSTLDMIFDDETLPPVSAVTKATEIPRKELETWAPSDLEGLFKEVAGLNPFFVALLARLKKLLTASAG